MARGLIVPNGNNNLNPTGSEYAALYTSNQTTNFLRKAIEYDIVNEANKKFILNQLINEVPLEDVDNDVFTYLSKIWSREIHTVQSATAPGASVTVTLTHATGYYDSFFPFQVNAIISGSDGISYIVTAATAANTANTSTFVIKGENDSASASSAVATQFVSGDTFTIEGVLKADGMTTLTGNVKPEFISYFNYVEIFERKCKWTELELAKIANTGTTNAMKYEWEESKEQLMLDQFVAFVNGKKAEFNVYDANSGTYKKAKKMDGFFTIMKTHGSPSANPTEAGLLAAFEYLALSTNKNVKGSNRMLLGTTASLNMLEKALKRDKIRYTP